VAIYNLLTISYSVSNSWQKMVEKMNYMIKLKVFLIAGLIFFGAFMNNCGSKSSGPKGNPPSAPTDVVAVAGPAQITVKWGSVLSATSYNIYWSNTSGVTKGNGTKISGLTSEYTIAGLENGATYYCIVTAVNSHGESAASDQASATPSATGLPPSAPTGVTAIASGTQITVSWDSVTNATSYNLYWSTTPGNSVKITDVTSPYIQTGLTPWITYYYRVTAVNSYGESLPSYAGAVTDEYIYSVGKWPEGIAIDSSGIVWVANYGDATISKLNSNGMTIGTYNVGYPEGIAIDSAGNVWIANGFDVVELNSNGATIGTYGILEASHLTIDSSGNVWVNNEMNNTVTKFNSSGITIGTYGVGNTPKSIAIDGSGNVWVANLCGNDFSCNSNSTVTELNSSGITIGTYGVGRYPEGIAIDNSGNVWIADWGINTLTELNSSGITVGTYTVGSGPYGIAIDASGNVWVTDYGDNTVAELAGITKGPQYFPYAGPQFPGGGNF
jgi:streptogramin lyase